MGHLLKLADEYEVQGVVDLCVKCLKDVPKSEENVVKILYLATDTLKAGEDSRLDSVRRDCEILVKDMDLANITAKGDFKNLNRDSMEKVFVKRTERLESFIKDVHPQLIGLVEYCLYLKLEPPLPCVTRCPQHLPPGNSLGSRSTHIGLLQRINSCFGCRDMITQLVSSSYKPVQTITQEDASESLPVQASPTGVVKEHVYGGAFHFDEKLITVLQGINKIVDLPLPRFGTSTTKTPASSSLGTTAASLPASFSSGTSTIASPASFILEGSTTSFPASFSTGTSTTISPASLSLRTSTISSPASFILGGSTTSTPASFSSKTSTTYPVPTSFIFGTSTTRSPPSFVLVTSAATSPALFSSVTSTTSCSTSFTFGTPRPSPGFFSSIGSLKEEVGNDQKPRGRKAK